MKLTFYIYSVFYMIDSKKKQTESKKVKDECIIIHTIS